MLDYIIESFDLENTGEDAAPSAGGEEEVLKAIKALQICLKMITSKKMPLALFLIIQELKVTSECLHCSCYKYFLTSDSDSL